MWILEWIPFWIFDVALIIGVIGFFVTYLLRFIPMPSLYLYKTPIQILSVLLIIICVYMLGSIANEETWKLKIAEYEAKIAETNAEHLKTNLQLQEVLQRKKEVIRERGDKIIKYIDRWNTKEIIKEIPGPEIIKELTKDMDIQQRKQYELEIETLKQNQGKVIEIIKYIDNCPVPKEFIELHNKAATINRDNTK